MVEVNRCLDDPNLDDVDHALGRPKCAFGGYRNHYAASRGSDEQVFMAWSPWWRRVSPIAREGDLICYAVTQEGREALHEHLAGI